MAGVDRSSILIAPYLPIGASVEFAGWVIAPPKELADEWPGRELREACEALLGKYVDSTGSTLDHPALIVHRGSGLGAAPTDEQLQALQMAIHLSAIDQNPDWTPSVQGWSVLTSDNSELHLWTLDLEEGHVATQTGSVVRKTTMGWKVTDAEFVMHPPLELHLPIATSDLDPQLLDAMYSIALRSNSQQGDPRAHRVCVAVNWLSKAWRNTPSIGWEDRIVLMRTAFEGLTGVSQTASLLKRLRAIFESLGEKGADLDAEELLWSASETEHMESPTNVTRDFTDLEHWFWKFSQTRNSIIHEGIVPELTYNEPNSAYSGPLFSIADRVLREAIKVEFETLGYADLWRSRLWRTVSDAYTQVQETLNPRSSKQYGGSSDESI